MSRGVLSDNIRLDDADGEEGIAYVGAWNAITIGAGKFEYIQSVNGSY